jgi:probable addiction module antidote protein
MTAAVTKAKDSKAKAARKRLPYRSHEEATIESFRKDPKFAAEYLNAILEDGDQAELLVALRYMAEAFGGLPNLAQRARLNATTLYRTLSPKGNPELKSMSALLKAMGMRLAVQPIARNAR